MVDFVTQLWSDRLAHMEEVRPDDNWRKRWREWREIIELRDAFSPIEENPDLFGGLTNRRRDEVRVAIVASPARESEVPRPWIANALRATNKEKAVRRVGENQGNGSMRA